MCICRDCCKKNKKTKNMSCKILFALDRGKFVPKLAAVFIPSTLMKGTSLNCECCYKQSALRDEEGVGRVSFGKGLYSG